MTDLTNHHLQKEVHSRPGPSRDVCIKIGSVKIKIKIGSVTLTWTKCGRSSSSNTEVHHDKTTCSGCVQLFYSN